MMVHVIQTSKRFYIIMPYSKDSREIYVLYACMYAVPYLNVTVIKMPV